MFGGTTRRSCANPSPLEGEGAEQQSCEAGEGVFIDIPLTRPLAALASTLSLEGRGWARVLWPHLHSSFCVKFRVCSAYVLST